MTLLPKRQISAFVVLKDQTPEDVFVELAFNQPKLPGLQTEEPPVLTTTNQRPPEEFELSEAIDLSRFYGGAFLRFLDHLVVFH